MAKGNMLLGQAIGSIGDITFSRSNGKQVIKSKPSQVKNPQTKAQMIQRILMTTVVQAYSKMANICDHSFEGVSVGANSMAYFLQRNAKLLRYTLAQIGDLNAEAPMFLPLGSNGLASNSYVIAKGQLPEIIPTVGTGGITIALAANTYQAVLDATGMSRGEQLTIVTVSGNDVTNQKFIYSRIILDPVDESGNPVDLDVEFVDNGAIAYANSRNENLGHTYSFAGGDFEASVSGQSINMGACIASRQKEDGSWLRSNAALLLADGAAVGYSMQEALDLFEAGGIDVESNRYLNNARKNAAAATSSSPDEPVVLLAPEITGTTPFSTTTQVSIQAEQGAAIYYTIDGSNPTSASTQYTAPFTLSDTATVKAIARQSGHSSAVATKTFTKEDDEPIPGGG